MIDLNLADPQHVQALLRLKEAGPNNPFLSFLEAEIEDAAARLMKADDMVTIHRLQGRAEALKDLLAAIEESHKVVRRS